MTFGSVCDGIGCGHLAFVNAGFECVWSAEIEPFPCAVLAHRFPDVPNHGDMNTTAGLIERGEIAAPDVFIGGTPCQAFSVAGKRKGLSDARGNLSLTFCGIADAIDDVRRRDGKPPCVVLWENVPGVLSDNGNAFGCFLGELAGSGCELQPAGDGWGNAGCVFGPVRTVSWRILDSQFFGVAQRRRRVFVVASAGNIARPEEILFEREGLRRDSPPSRETREGIAADAGGGVAVSLRAQSQCSHRADTETFVPVVCGCLSDGAHNGETRGQDPVVVCAAHGQANAEIQVNMCPTLSCNHEAPIAATYDMRGNGDGETVGTLTGDHAGRPTDYTPVAVIGLDEEQNASVELMGCLKARENGGGFEGSVMTQNMSVRRLTPMECERLQALPDRWTAIPRKGKTAEECPDGPRYKGVGNGQTVLVMEWLAKRIKTAIENGQSSPV